MLYLAWILSLIGTFGSLYVSEIMGYMPCDLCWYQRICLFPLCIILAIALWKNFKGIALYVLPLTIIGFFVALCQTLMHEIPAIESLPLCGQGASCESPVFELFGFLSLPILSTINFAFVSLFLGLCLKHQKSM